MQISLSLGLLGLTAAEGQEFQTLQQGLVRLCPTGVNLPGLSERDTRLLENLRSGETLRPIDLASAAASLVRSLQSGGFLGQAALGRTPGVRLFQDPPVPLERLSFPSYGGVNVTTSAGAVWFGGSMWANKDVILTANQGKETPACYVQAWNSPHIGMMGFEFLRNNVFVTRKVPTFVVDDETQARALNDFLRQTYESTDPVAAGVFPSPPHEALRTILCFAGNGTVAVDGGVTLERLRPQVFRISENERVIGVLNLETFSRLEIPSPIRTRSSGKKAEGVRRAAIEEKRAGLWPIGTANGFATREETSGFMVWNRGRFVLVDPPSSTLDFLAAHKIPLNLLDGIILTHGHTDHCTDAVPRILEIRPKTRIYTTQRIFTDLARQLDVALGGKAASRLDFNYRRFTEVRPRAKTKINGMTFRFHETLHSIPALGFEIWNGEDLVVHFSGDTLADPAIFAQFAPERTSHMTRERAFEVLRHYFLIPQRASQKVPPVFLIEAGIPPLHTSPDLTRDYLEYLRRHLGVDTSRVFAYHISDAKAREAKLRKWSAGHEGWIDLSPYYQ